MAYAASTRAASILRGVLLGMAFAGLLWPTLTSADSVDIPLTGGMLTIQNGGSDSFLTATGPDFSIGAPSGPLFVSPRCPIGPPCSPGSSFSPSTSVFGAIGGSVSYNGVSRPINDQSAVPGTAFASWSASAAPILMPPIGNPFTVTEPFLITLQVNLPNCATCFAGTGTIIHAAGAGGATFSFAPTTTGTPAWNLTSGAYEIVTPEPATGVLSVTALIIMGAAYLRRRRKGAAP
jgi:hypothetical protein